MFPQEVVSMQSAPGEVASGNASLGRRRWWLLVPVFLLSCLSAYLFVKFLGAAFFYSDWGPLTSTTPADKVPELASASHRAHVFFLYSAAAAAFAALLMGPVIQLNSISSKGYRLLVRYFLALILCILIMGVLVWIMGIVNLG
jgi:hypothetical protein